MHLTIIFSVNSCEQLWLRSDTLANFTLLLYYKYTVLTKAYRSPNSKYARSEPFSETAFMHTRGLWYCVWTNGIYWLVWKRKNIFFFKQLLYPSLKDFLDGSKWSVFSAKAGWHYPTRFEPCLHLVHGEWGVTRYHAGWVYFESNERFSHSFLLYSPRSESVIQD